MAALIKVFLLLGAAAKGIASQAVGSATVTRHATSSEIAVRTSPGLDATVSWTTAHCMPTYYTCITLHTCPHVTHMPTHYTHASPHITHMPSHYTHASPHITHNHAYAHACPHITLVLAYILYSHAHAITACRSICIPLAFHS